MGRRGVWRYRYTLSSVRNDINQPPIEGHQLCEEGGREGGGEEKREGGGRERGR